MSAAPTDCRVPDPSDKLDAKADGQFQSVNRRAGYGDDRLDRIIATARKGWTLAAGEGLVLVQEIDRLREERDAIAKRFTGACDMSRQYAQTYGIARAGDNVFQTMRDDAERQRRILAALREPTDHIIVSAYDELCLQDHDNARYSLADTIRAAVAAAEREVANDEG